MPESPTPIRALLVDYGEVLCHAPHPDELAGMAALARAALPEFTEAYWHLRPAYDRGELDGPAFWRLVGEGLGAPLDAERAIALVERDIELWSRLDEPMLAWANDVAASGVPVGLLSNMVPEIGAHLRDGLAAFASFTAVTYSYEVGLAKPDARIYRVALDSLGAEPHETLFVDDRLPNVEAARALGLHVHHFLGRDGLEAEIARLYSFVSGTS